MLSGYKDPGAKDCARQPSGKRLYANNCQQKSVGENCKQEAVSQDLLAEGFASDWLLRCRCSPSGSRR